jgi:hypothetical protein
MNKLILIFCLVLVIPVRAQVAPKVVFTGDHVAYTWQATPQFLGNSNWIGAGVNICCADGSFVVEEAFQANVINQHPTFVFITTGEVDLEAIHDPVPIGVAWDIYAQAIMQMVSMAEKANIKVIIGNTPAQGYWAQTLNVWLGQYAAVNHIPVVNFHDALCQCTGVTPDLSTYPQIYQLTTMNDSIVAYDISPAGYALMTQMAQAAIATYGLTLKSGYLSNVITIPVAPYEPLTSQVNSVIEGEQITFTPQAKWSDGVVRPMLNQDYNGLKGTWTSSNPFVMTINQQGQATAYGAGKATISFRSASGVVFSPWVMTVEQMYPPYE